MLYSLATETPQGYCLCNHKGLASAGLLCYKQIDLFRSFSLFGEALGAGASRPLVL